MEGAQDHDVLPLCHWIGQARCGPPTPGPHATEDVAVIKKAIQHRVDGGSLFG